MGLFDFLLGDDKERNRRHREQEMANMYEMGWDEPEESKYDNQAREREQFANYEYSEEEDE